MEIKNALVSRLVKSVAPDSYGKWSFQLEFSNGDKGYYNTKSGDQVYFVQGQPADYLIEAKTSKAGSTYYVITHPEEKAAVPAGAGGFKKPDPKVQIIGFAMSYTKDLIVAGKVSLGDLEKEFNRIHALMASKL
jgi:hypothetical protein